MLITAVVGIDTQKALSYQLFALSFIYVAVALIYSKFFRAHFSIQRQLPNYCSVNEKFTYQMRITNLNQSPYERLSVLDINKSPEPGFTNFHQTREPKRAANNFFDRFFRYPRWNWIINKNTLARTTLVNIPDLKPNQTISVAMPVMPLRRGIFHFSHADIYQDDYLGIYRAKFVIKKQQSIVILPKRYRIPEFQLAGKRQHNPGGISNAGSIGDAEEFVSLRDYRPGDSIRKIHWKSWAKTNQPIVKQYQEEYFSRFGLILDTFGNEHSNDIFEEAVSLAASYISSLHTEDSLVDLMFVSNKAHQISMGRGINQMGKLLEVLASVKLQEEERFKLLYSCIEEHIGVLNNVILILIDYDQARKNLITLFELHNIPCKVFLVSTANTSNTGKLDVDKKIIQLEVGAIDIGLATA